jgi:hypothetical protein
MPSLASSNPLVPQVIAILVPIITGYITKWLTQALKKVNTFAASRPAVKQLVTFVISFLISLATTKFGTTDVSVILNTVLGGALAQLFYNGQKVSAVVVPPSTITAP